MAEKRAKTARSAKAVAKKPAAKKSSRPPAKKVAKTASKKVASIAARKPKPANEVVSIVESAMDDIKAVNVRVLDVRKLTDIADTLVIASGNSDRHVRSIADRVVEFAKKAGFRPMGVEGERDGEWVLVDLQDVIVHIMLPRVREFYRLESLWDVSAARREAAAGGE
ncbi:MAG TPA: ribosome silencing factor [Steroidobacteraceae bacterium]|nr:ribosome silencing factor [Steroidobacteraceae bacterium]